MSKLAGKFLTGITVVLVAVTVLSLYLNSNFIEKYYLYEKKNEIDGIYQEMIEGKNDLDDTISRLEKSEDVVIARVKNSSDNDLLNQKLREAFLEKGLGLEQFWLWDQDQEAAVKNGSQLKIYNQKKLHYSLLVEYAYIEGDIAAIAMIIPNMQETISLINRMTTEIFLAAAFVMILFIYVLVKKITIPLRVIQDATKDIAEQNFCKINIKTKDELEVLAEHINDMSAKLQTSQEALEEKNKQMKELLANVSHDLKTPVSLIKAYTSGIKDGIDDGTFLDTIVLQNEKMERMIIRLLDLAKIQNQNQKAETITISPLLFEIIEQYRISVEGNEIRFAVDIEKGIVVTAIKEDVVTIFTNLISNAVKYTCDGEIKITLSKSRNHSCFQITNRLEEGVKLEISRLWEPFYVGEKSRNKNMSGTGLGLSIVQAAAQKNKFGYDCTVKDSLITFTIDF